MKINKSIIKKNNKEDEECCRYTILPIYEYIYLYAYSYYLSLNLTQSSLSRFTSVLQSVCYKFR